MNYGKKSTAKKRTALISRSSMMGKRARVSFIRVLFVSLIALCIAVACLGVGSFRGVIDNAPDVNDIDIMPLGYATFLYDDAGNQIRKLAAPNSNRLPVTLDQIPVDLQHAVVAIEDERFYEHNGIDVKGILRAGMKAITTGDFSEGASTITQQLLKNNVFTNWTSESTQLERFTRKFQEQYLAVQVEKKTNKDTILENYLNTINLGAGSYGVQAAARQYFDKDVWDLNLSECATLAGITQNPTKFNPIINPESNQKRRKEVLQHMLDQNYITQDQYDEALADDVYSRIQAAQEKNSSTENTVYTYFEDELTDQIINDLMNIKGYTKTQATNLLYSGGLKVYTTQDSTIQNILDEEYSDPSNYPDTVQYELDYALTVTDPDGNQVNYSKEMLQLYFQNEDPGFDLLFDSPEEGQTYVDRYKESILADGSKVVAERVNFAPQPQSSMSVIDQHTGYVKALIGGRGEKTASLTLNRATDTTRQPGSTFKIVSTYAPALNEKGMTLATTFEDEPYEYPDGSPVNNATRSYNGTTTIRTAIQNSINVVAVKCFEEVTPDLGLKYLDNFGFTTLAHGTEADTDANGNVWSDANLATALGGITNGVTNVELCASYAAIANGGNYIKPIYYTKILDHNGNVLIENTSAERSVIKESTAYLLTSAMEDVVKKGTGTACQLDNMAVAGKTGTTEAYNDLWFVGYTPYYTCAVWSGYDNNEKLPDYARNFHKNLWKKVMTRIHEGLPSKEFEKPASVEKLSVCEETGLLPRAGCPVITEYFDVGTMPTEYCDQHFYDESYDEYDYNYDNSDESSSQTDANTDDANNDSDTNNNGDDSNGGEDNDGEDNGDGGDYDGDNGGDTNGGEDDSSYQIDYY
ncbi:PBP1A family penicillin-binding protein [Ruminococcus sp. AF37-6AT]|jgi:penicillin-binding protein 1A|nr:PBP1A family penicillin-binding protein [Ruminococcus sp. AF13-37]RGW17998.1 PBP1A family penicillin-binding protein [Ruminococcus sp. AF13-28]RHD91086.1 PBP1A family penicillin-binding protein [Ruminococcus sp. AM30-15AC]RHL43168.1 PBP1A family penicillin-binding protein [Ruminococcus sp. AF37-6AT]RHP53366.1 PBP1A family penicillin-binding protein [Ruminococcus sp. AF31-16BH]RHQ61358.1 PBP1A family penicillin-binding protein [Ruminococcus sp. AF24-32LB]